MIKNFDVIKGQLEELAPILNSFKAEAVQLRIVELIFEAGESIPERSPGGQTPVKQRTVSKAAASKKDGEKRKRKPGLTATLDQLIDNGYFSQGRNIQDIQKHCRESLATNYQSTSISVYLARATQSGKLKRATDSNGQYVYTKR